MKFSLFVCKNVRIKVRRLSITRSLVRTVNDAIRKEATICQKNDLKKFISKEN
ncbi:hypothetical protein TH8N_19610 [Tetragenococcus halophilus]|nr:hypothetical protein TH8N_19610 [Tetragenococcus halophilus]